MKNFAIAVLLLVLLASTAEAQTRAESHKLEVELDATKIEETLEEEEHRSKSPKEKTTEEIIQEAEEFFLRVHSEAAPTAAEMRQSKLFSDLIRDYVKTHKGTQKQFDLLTKANEGLLEAAEISKDRITALEKRFHPTALFISALTLLIIINFGMTLFNWQPKKS